MQRTSHWMPYRVGPVHFPPRLFLKDPGYFRLPEGRFKYLTLVVPYIAAWSFRTLPLPSVFQLP